MHKTVHQIRILLLDKVGYTDSMVLLKDEKVAWETRENLPFHGTKLVSPILQDDLLCHKNNGQHRLKKIAVLQKGEILIMY